MDKFKVGDKVRIRCPRSKKYIGGIDIEMYNYFGMYAVITRIAYNGKAYKLNVDDGRFVWDERLLAKCQPEKVHFKSLDQYFSGKLEIENGLVIKKEEKKEILDKIEKEYLENLLRPFRNKVETIRKCVYDIDTEYLTIYMKNSCDTFNLPNFKPNTMYKGMEQYKEYTLKELGLFESKKK